MIGEKTTQKAIMMAGVSVLSLSVAGALSAQDTNANTQGFEEITVSAQKRDQALSDVPIAISAFDASFTKRTNLDDVKDLIKFTPGFSGNSKDSFIDYVNVRGISTNDFGVGADPSVGFFKNGFYQGRNGAAVTSLFDMERSEVLRGPQGFLFGRSAIGGAVNLHTAKPVLGETSGNLEFGIGERGIMEGEAAFNIASGETSALRVAGYGSTENGYVENALNPSDKKAGGHDKYAVRVSGLIEGDNWDALLIAEHENRKQSGSTYHLIDGEETIDFFREIFPDVDFDGSDNPRSVNIDEGLGDADDGKLTSLTATLNYEFDFATLTSATGFKDHTYFYAEDFDGAPIALNNYQQDQRGSYFEQELRLVSNSENDLSWYAGVSYYQEDIDVVWDQQANEDAVCAFYYYYYYGSRNCAEFNEYLEYPEFTANPNQLLESGKVNGNYDGWGAYFDLTYAMSQDLELGFGVRYSKDSKKFSMRPFDVDSELGPFFAYGFGSNFDLVGDESWDDFTPRLVARYTPGGGEWMYYASVARGYKSGGFGSFSGTVIDENEDFFADTGSTADPFEPESSTSFELGTKGSLMDRKVLIDLTGYYYTYKNMQLTIFDPTAKVVNIGKVKSKGLEGSVQAILSDKFDFYAAGSWNDNSVSQAESIAEGSTGNRLPGVPKFSLAAVLNYRTPIGETGELTASIDVATQTKIFGGLDNNEFSAVGGWTDVSARIGYHTEEGWGVVGYVENLFNEVYYDGSNEPAGELLPGNYYGVSRPTTIGVRFNVKFGG